MKLKTLCIQNLIGEDKVLFEIPGWRQNYKGHLSFAPSARSGGAGNPGAGHHKILLCTSIKTHKLFTFS